MGAEAFAMFYELLGVIVSVVQMALRIAKLDDYIDKWDDLSAIQKQILEELWTMYTTLDAIEDTFNSWYDGIAQHTICTDSYTRPQGLIATVSDDMRKVNNSTPCCLRSSVQQFLVLGISKYAQAVPHYVSRNRVTQIDTKFLLAYKAAHAKYGAPIDNTGGMSYVSGLANLSQNIMMSDLKQAFAGVNSAAGMFGVITDAKLQDWLPDKKKQ